MKYTMKILDRSNKASFKVEDMLRNKGIYQPDESGFQDSRIVVFNPSNAIFVSPGYMEDFDVNAWGHTNFIKTDESLEVIFK